MSRRKSIIISIVGITIILLSLLGITFGYYYSKIIGNTNDKSISINMNYLELTYDDGNGLITAYNIIPGETIATKTFNVKNTGNTKISNYVVYLDDVVNTFVDKNDLKLTINCTSDIGNCNGTKVVYPSNNTILVTNNIEKDETQNYELKIEFIETNDDQSDNASKKISGNILIKDIKSLNKELLNESGNSIISLNNPTFITSFRLYGNSIQDGTPTPSNPVEIESVGDKTKNMCDVSVIKSSNDVVVNNDGSISVNKYPTSLGVTLKELCPGLNVGDTVTLSGETDAKLESSNTYLSRFYLTNIALTWTYGTSKTVTQEMLDSSVSVYSTKKSDGTLVPATHKNIQIELGSIATGYEPYNKYKIPLAIYSGKNMFNVNKVDKTIVNQGYLEIANNGYNILKTSSFTNGMAIGKLSDFAPNLYVGDKFKITFETNAIRNNSAVNYIYLNIYKSTLRKGVVYTATQEMLDSKVYIYSGGTENCYYKDIMFYKNGETEEYEEYQEPTNTNIIIDEPLRKIGNYADYIDLKSKKVVRNITKKVFNGTETWYSYDNTSVFYTTDSTLKYDENVSCLTNNYLGQTSAEGQSYKSGNAWVQSASEYPRIYFADDNYNSVTEFKNNLTTNNITGLYVLQSPIESDLESIDLPLLNGLATTIRINTSVSPSNNLIEYVN